MNILTVSEQHDPIPYYMNTPLCHSLQYHQQFVDVSCFGSKILSILNPLREIISDNFMLILEFRNILLITVGMCVADFSNFQFFWPQNIIMDFTSQVQSVFNSLNCFPFPSFERSHKIKTIPTTQTNRTTMNFLLMLASLMALLVSVASDTTYPILGMSRTFYPSDEYTVTCSLTAFCQGLLISISQ